MKRRLVFALAMAGMAGFACSPPQQGVPDESSDVPQEVVIPDTAIPDAAETPVGDVAPLDEGVTSADGWAKPAGYATLRFKIDDTANRTYLDGQMKWQGSFTWNASDNTVIPASGWQPTDGPFPPLYDDGPISAGGHEPEGATQGDHVFECAVWLKADADTDFEYGAMNEFDRWIWIGPNGKFTVAKGSTDEVVAEGLTLPKFGDQDFRVTVDLNHLHKEFAGSVTPFNPATGEGNHVYLKGSANSWTPLEIQDDGQKGDATAGDGIYTYVQSTRLQAGGHDGLVATGQHVQFVFVFAVDGVSADDGQEYKVTDAATGVHCPIEGVAAASGPTGQLVAETVVFERDSKGKVFNTGFVVGGGGATCAGDADCVDPAGAATLECDAGTKTCKVKGTVVVSKPNIVLVDPDKGPVSGGTEVTLTGEDFRDGATVKFGADDATQVVFKSATEVHAWSPAHAKGPVTVVLTNPDAGSTSYPNGFQFVEQVAPKLPDWGKLDAPTSVASDAGTTTQALWAEVYAKGYTENGATPVGLSAEVGYGPAGTNPMTDASWVFEPASWGHAGGTGNNNAFYSGTLNVTAAAAYAFTFRFSLDGANWLYVDSDGASGATDFSAAALGALQVNAVDPSAPKITGVSPAFGTTLGGTQVTVTGTSLTGALIVTLGGAAVTATTTADGFTFTTPAHVLGIAALSVRNGAGKTASRDDAFAFVPKGTPTPDGDLGSDWDPTWLAASTGDVSSWDPAKNAMTELRVAYDDTNLYIGVKGFCEAANAIVAYVDRDFGASTGVKDLATLTDNSGALDAAISSRLKVTVAGFGADVAVGTKGMAGATGAATDSAGWRDLAKPADFPWDAGTVATKAGGNGFEASVSLVTLFGGAKPAGGSTLAIVVRIVDADGANTNHQCLPQLVTAGDGLASDAVAIVPIRW